MFQIFGNLDIPEARTIDFCHGEIGHWLNVEIGYYLDNYLPFNKLIPKT